MKRSEILSIVMGIIIALCGGYFLTKEFLHISSLDIVETASYALLVIGGITIATALRRNIRKAIICSMSIIAISAMIDKGYIVFTSTDIIATTLGFFYIALSIILLYYSVSLIFNTGANSIRGMICLGLMFLVEMGPSLYRIYMGEGLIQEITTHLDDNIMGAMHLMVVIILTRKDMLLETTVRRLIRSSKYLYNEMCTPADAYIDFREAHIFLDGGGDGWIHHDSGPLESERVIRLYRSDTSIMLQRWRGDNRLYFSSRLDKADSYMPQLSFAIEKAIEEKDEDGTTTFVRLFGTDGIFVDLLVKDPDDEKKGYIETMRFKGRKKKERKMQAKAAENGE